MPLSRLNKEQYTAATAPAGHNLIIASAGTGKTSTIVARIAHLLNLGIDAKRILLLTFTNKAAAEMIERLNRYFDKKITAKITAGTFHSVSYSLLKELGKGVVLKQPSELKILLKSLVERRKFHHLSDVKPYGGAYLYDLYSLYQNSVSDVSFADWLKLKSEEQGVYAEIYEDILNEFESEKAKFGYADFNDLLIKMRDELKNGAPLDYDEILIDEYQDTNTLQGSLISAFKTKSLFCVGDFDQSIYAFNGANIEIIGSFKDRFKDANIYALNVNYRSSSSILALANKVIANNPRLYEKHLSVSREGKFKAPTLLVYNELFEQYSAIADIISLSPFSRENIAVIFRNNSSADGIEVALKERCISSKRKGGVSFFESREIKALVDIMGIFINPKDIMAFIHICEYAKGVGSALSKEIFDALVKLGHGNLIEGLLNPDENVSIASIKRHNYQLGLFDDLDEFADVSRFKELKFSDRFLAHPILKMQKLSEGGALFLYEIYNFLKSARRLARPNSLINEIRESKIYELIVENLSTKRATLKNGNVDPVIKGEARERIMRKSIVLSELSKNYNDVEKFYNFITLGSNEMSEGEGVSLLSVHASKGLEFDQVFIVDLAQNRFPNLKLMSMGGSLEEERRLFYVAVTRARDELYLSYAKFDKIKKITYQPSCFLIEAGMASAGI
ncbi:MULTISPECIES: ATP-dependent helicase [Campylobacter]|uniref:DNA 3'-5' helicase n=1 Tax=Campylobacter curvus (strain 525.92) TaxID=360105 RepID=A7GYF6_CAMC5|nr:MULTISPECIES: ATP-dependent helicase [Campylobacter]EAU00133.1 ATP-dependent DNA helicase [Campylobacter curvus 525.92]MBN7288987.1 ATP-dependent helicase [Campylobacter curvus]MDU6827215.1 ATP-dependent helicase [Campylobacter sp.]